MSLNNKSKSLTPIDTISLIDITNEYINEGECQLIKKLFKLTINDKCPFDEFLNIAPKKVSNKEKIIEELDGCLTLLIEGKYIPPHKFQPIGSNEFEIRIKRTRIYLFFDHPNKNIVVLGHYNKTDNDQQLFITKFRDLKSKYLKQKNNE